MVKRTDIKQRILDAALKLAEESSWEEIRLSDIATELDISLLEIQKHFSQKDELVEAWFDRADQAMLQLTQNELSELALEDRIIKIIFTWLDALAEHKTITREMLWYKLEPLHVHLQIQGLLRISRTVQWIQELSRINAQYMKRIANELGLTSIYLCTFLYWLQDDSSEQKRTRVFLKRKLKCIQSCCCSLEKYFHSAKKPFKTAT
ncbi:MAG: TetR family transcriptional regulator [Gammaproteobacteria bacterium]